MITVNLRVVGKSHSTKEMRKETVLAIDLEKSKNRNGGADMGPEPKSPGPSSG